MTSTTYATRRGQLTTYFDRTAVEAWSRLTSDAPVSRIRATVRAGRDAMRGTLLSWLPADMRGMRLLDAGCGTGLCGPYLRPYAARLTGIDLSGNMLDKARSRAEYDALERAEVTSFLAAHTGAFDLVASADTLVYFGDLAAVLAGCAAALRPGGRLVFNVEEDGEGGSGAGFRLQPNGRYAHRESYAAAQIEAAGLSLIAVLREPYRRERGAPVPGLFFVAAKG